MVGMVLRTSNVMLAARQRGQSFTSIVLDIGRFAHPLKNRGELVDRSADAQ
jgi:hypothetical protein